MNKTFVLAIMLAGVVAGRVSAQPITSNAPGEMVDLRSKLDPKDLHDGPNLVYQSRDGLLLLAKAKGGKVIDWEAQDPGGRQAQIAYKAEGDDCHVLATYMDRRGKERVINVQTTCPPVAK